MARRSLKLLLASLMAGAISVTGAATMPSGAAETEAAGEVAPAAQPPSADAPAALTVSLVKDISTSFDLAGSPESITPLGNIAIFTAATAEVGREIWKTDGTAAGTVLVKDINNGPTSSEPRALAAANGLVYFAAYDAEFHTELWRTDGTEAGTFSIGDYGYGAVGPSHFVAFGHKVLFVNQENTSGRELWATDGSSHGTFVVKDISPSWGIPPESGGFTGLVVAKRRPRVLPRQPRR